MIENQIRPDKRKWQNERLEHGNQRWSDNTMKKKGWLEHGNQKMIR